MKVRSSAHACCRRRAFSQLPIFKQIAERDGFHDGIGGAESGSTKGTTLRWPPILAALYECGNAEKR